MAFPEQIQFNYFIWFFLFHVFINISPLLEWNIIKVDLMSTFLRMRGSLKVIFDSRKVWKKIRGKENGEEE